MKHSSYAMRRSLTGLFVFAVCVFSTLPASTVFAQPVTDPFPDIPLGNVEVAPTILADGLEFEAFPFAGGAIQRVSMADSSPVPGNGTGLMAMTYFGGRIDIYDDTGSKMIEPLLDIVATNPDLDIAIAHGITAMTFHPDFANQGEAGYGKFYVVETESNVGTADFVDSVRPGTHHQEALYEYTLPSTGTLACGTGCTKRELFRVQQPGWHHNIGDIVFGQDDLLYISSGDGSTTGVTAPIMSDNSLDLTTFFGGILRIDPLGNNSANGNYGIPADNPFIDGPGGNVDEMFAYGLRNPYRMDVDPLTGKIYVSETGETQIESIEEIVSGGNYGWNEKEGSFLYDKFTREIFVDEDLDGDGLGDVAQARGYLDPVLEYDHDDGVAVIGGVLYRGSMQPELDGMYVFADFGGRLFYGDPQSGQIWEFQVDGPAGVTPDIINSIEEDANGELLAFGIRFVNGNPEGVISRLTGMPQVECDFDDNSVCNIDDIDLLVSAISQSTGDVMFDLTGDGSIDEKDIDAWLLDAGINAIGASFLLGDANLDGVVDGSDFNIWNSSKFESTGKWSRGDLNADGVTDASDFNIWNSNRFRSSVVPEPEQHGLLAFLVILVAFRRLK